MTPKFKVGDRVVRVVYNDEEVVSLNPKTMYDIGEVFTIDYIAEWGVA